MLSKVAPSIPGYRSEPEEEEFLGKTPRTLAQWRKQRKGPPVTFVGRTPYYSISSTDAWLLRQETDLTYKRPELRRRARQAAAGVTA
jgi:hypothetical protein